LGKVVLQVSIAVLGAKMAQPPRKKIGRYTYDVARNYLPRGEQGKGISMMDNMFEV